MIFHNRHHTSIHNGYWFYLSFVKVKTLCMLLLMVKILTGISGSSKLCTHIVLVYCIQKQFCKMVFFLCRLQEFCLIILCILVVLLYAFVVLKGVCINGSVLMYGCLLLLQMKVVLNLCILWVVAFYKCQHCNPFSGHENSYKKLKISNKATNYCKYNP